VIINITITEGADSLLLIHIPEKRRSHGPVLTEKLVTGRMVCGLKRNKLVYEPGNFMYQK
jgi:hypothetical protein